MPEPSATREVTALYVVLVACALALLVSVIVPN
jgi:hypothetical protein